MANTAGPASGAYMFNNKWLSDVLLRVHGTDGTIVEFPAHRERLVTRSAYFMKMFNENSFKEAKEKVVDLKDVDLKHFEIALYWMYTKEERDVEDETVAELLENVVLLYHIADFYIIPSLLQHCVDRFRDGAMQNFDSKSDEFRAALLDAADLYYKTCAETESSLGRCVVKLVQKVKWTKDDNVGDLQKMLKKHPLFALDYALETTRQNSV
ncbi:POZ domain-containing protein [Lophium mytilinum]|uniref:POZ domain-containing protein n=1 Tax=Lophium mytilinum TaxID=390894 RepID=A0A6A6RAX9_9PEZI|nr:POZ domain-containing protein [Lophium mytilinum]